MVGHKLRNDWKVNYSPGSDPKNCSLSFRVGLGELDRRFCTSRRGWLEKNHRGRVRDSISSNFIRMKFACFEVFASLKALLISALANMSSLSTFEIYTVFHYSIAAPSVRYTMPAFPDQFSSMLRWKYVSPAAVRTIDTNFHPYFFSSVFFVQPKQKWKRSS